jgi:hypothetical protein
VEHGAGVALGPYKASECGWGGVAWHDGFSGPMVVRGGDGANVWSTMWPMYPGVFMTLWRWQTVSFAAWDLREGRP